MKNRSTLIAFISALLLHIIAGTLLLLNVNFSNLKTQPKNEVPIINATVVDQKLFDDLAQRKNEKKEAERKKAEQEKQKIEQEKQRIQQEKKKAEDLRKKKEDKRIQAEKAETLRKKKEAERAVAEKKRAAEQLKAKQEAEKAKKVEAAKAEAAKVEAAKVEAAKVEAAKVEAAKVKAAAKAKVKAEQEKERLRRAELDKQMDTQFEDSFANAQSSRQLSEIARYTALIQDKIGRNWQVEPSMKGKSCTLRIRLAADGLVISATRSSGDLKLCESAKRAALKANTLPIPKDPDISTQFRDFDITLEPDL